MSISTSVTTLPLYRGVSFFGLLVPNSVRNLHPLATVPGSNSLYFMMLLSLFAVEDVGVLSDGELLTAGSLEPPIIQRLSVAWGMS